MTASRVDGQEGSKGATALSPASLVTGLTAGNYYLKLVRYDPDVLPSLHPPRLPVDQQVTVQ